MSARSVGGQAGAASSFDGILRSGVLPDSNALSDDSVVASAAASNPEYIVVKDRPGWRALTSKVGIGVLVALVLVGGVVTMIRRANRPSTLEVGRFDSTHLSLGEVAGDETLPLGTAQSLLVNGQLRVSNSVVVSPSDQPDTPTTGQLYYDKTSNQMAYYNGTQFVGVGGSTTTLIQNTTNVAGAGGLTAAGGTPNTIPKFTNSQRLGDSIISDNGSIVSVKGDIDLVSPSPGPSTELTLWTPSTTPAVAADPGDSDSVELGVKFTTDVSGFIKGIRFYKGTINTGTHVGNLWSSNGTLLATATFSSESASGWQEVRFSQPVAVAAETTYVASYFAPNGHYAVNTSYFSSGGVDNGSLHALRDGADGGNGVFRYSLTSTFPTQGFSGINYWVDVIFTPNPPPPRIRMNGVQIASSDLSNNSELAKRGSSQVFTGNNTFRSSADSPSAFSIQSASGTILLHADTANLLLYVGKPGGENVGVVLVLSNRNVTGNPAGAEGGTYYNAFDSSFRCYRYGTWDSCANLEMDHAYELNDEFMGGQTTTFATNSIIGSLGWHAFAIGANGGINFNPSAPAPAADRPGVLQLTTPAVANQGTTLSLSNANGASMLLAAGNIVKTSVAVGATTGQVLRVGLHNETTTTTQPLSGVWWEANPAVNANWRYCYGDGVTATCANTGIAIAANSWVRLEIRVRATGAGISQVTYYINGDPIVLANLTLDTTTRLSPSYTCYTTTGTAQNCYWDYFQLKSFTSAAR